MNLPLASFSVGLGLGIALAGILATDLQTVKMQREAVREKAGQWVNSESGGPEFRWKVCAPSPGLMKEIK